MPSAPADRLPIEIKPLGQAHDLTAFACGVKDLDEFLQNDALRYAERRIARVYVAMSGETVVGYVALVADSLILETNEKKRLKLEYRDPKYVPAIKVGRLATCKPYAGRGVATELLRFSIDVANLASQYVGCRLLTLDALPGAISFYENLGFKRNKLANKTKGKGKDKDKKKPSKPGGSTTTSFRLDLRAEELPDWFSAR